MAQLVRRAFSAIHVHLKQATRRLTAPVRYWTAAVRPTRPARSRALPRLEIIEDRIMAGDGTVAGMLATGWLLPDRSGPAPAMGVPAPAAEPFTVSVDTRPDERPDDEPPAPDMV